ncbi:hypothetical protein AMELA_G00246410 [Ameiurus melas]|uniref:Uncharacterized protein n=1 Tax=Ameiurus melas TaxID=219545 RepID=A0A7J5ZWU3_AMEME|nr:hypothetical protein AMELA_G00246410 [Ameiurus melas]
MVSVRLLGREEISQPVQGPNSGSGDWYRTKNVTVSLCQKRGYLDGAKCHVTSEKELWTTVPSNQSTTPSCHMITCNIREGTLDYSSQQPVHHTIMSHDHLQHQRRNSGLQFPAASPPHHHVT